MSHRLSSIVHADEILVLLEGCIVERGKHEDLIASDGVYSKMWQTQLDDKEDNTLKDVITKL